MGQVCIMNTTPEFSVSSCNTVCNSRISSVLCVPPIRYKRNTTSSNSTKTTNTTRFEEQSKHKPKRNDSSKDADESFIDTDSSDDDCGDSQSDDLHRNNNIPSTNQNETKFSSMWIGNDDGW